jgi:putative spermidine/putrescine transport system permease protein
MTWAQTLGRRTLSRTVTLLLACWFGLPLVPLIMWAGAGRWAFPALLPQRWSFHGVTTAVADGGVTAFARSALLALVVTAVATPLGGLAGFGLARRRAWSPRVTALILLSPAVLPPFAVSLGLDTVILRTHTPPLVGVVVVLSAVALPYTSYLMWLAGSAHDPHYAEEARTLGATATTAFWRVQLPLLAPALAGAAFLAFLVGWSDYIVTLTVGAGQLVTVPLLLASYTSSVGNESVVAVLALAGVVPPLVFYLLLNRLHPKQVRT